MKKIKQTFVIVILTSLGILFSSFSDPVDLEECISYVQKTLISHYDEEVEKSVVKRYELTVTNTGFCRYKRFYNSGKSEYFSFKLSKYKDLDYTGNTSQGKLILNTKGEDVIVQSYNDKHGDIDSMASALTIPIKNIEADDLNLLKTTFAKISNQLK